jgi:amino acid adenylation domain-containing protein
MFVLHNTPRQRIALPGLELSPVEFNNRAARFDLALDMYEGETYSGVFEYSTDLFRPSTIARLTGHFLRLLDAVTADPSRPLGSIDLLSREEHDALAARNRTAAPIPEADIATLIEARAAERGEAVALRFAGRELSYTALNAAANRLATHIRRRLCDLDGQPRIALCLPRSEELVIGLLAVLKLGAAYVPLDPSHPPARLRAALEDSQAALMLVRGAVDLEGDAPCPVLDLGAAAPAIAAEPDANPQRSVHRHDLAYVIFTSGSTGRPKGVPIRQDSLVNLLTSMAKTPGMSADDTFVAVTTPAFDIATLELLMPLLVGGTLVAAEPDTVYDDVALARLLATSGATMMQATPATWRLLVEGGWQAPAAFKILCGGEALDPALAKRLLGGGGELWNLYGPTETTIWSACARIRTEHATAGVIPLGEPVANTQLHVLDDHLQPVPTGVAGQLYIGGAGLSPGYWQRDDLTAAAFVANPFHSIDPAANSRRLYKTGDGVRRLDDGSLVYLGRLDFQVKLRGFRIELGDIEAALNAEPDIKHAVVTLHKHGQDDGELVAYCQAAPGREQGLEARLRAALAGRLPAYMIPSAFVLLDVFPLNANGKVDRKRLPRLEKTERADGFVAPRTSTEALVADLWGEILCLPRIGREDNFFDRGGHSLLAARMIARLRPIFETTLPLRTLFEAPRLKDFCAVLDAALGTADEARGGAIPLLARGGPLPLSFAQQRLWTLAQLEPDSPFYNIPGAVRLKGEPDFPRLAKAFEHLCARHEVLRSRFVATHGKASVEVLPRVCSRWTRCSCASSTTRRWTRRSRRARTPSASSTSA